LKLTIPLAFRTYCVQDKTICLEIFDRNCPQYFAPNERQDYETFLDSNPKGYELCSLAGSVVGAYGISEDQAGHQNLNWILLSPTAQGTGVGSAIMKRVLMRAKDSSRFNLYIAASHLSAPFFAKFGATIIKETEDGWGPGMHRVDMVIKQ